MSSQRPFVPALTGIRFVAALMVLVGHGTGILPQGAPGSTAAFWIAQITSVGMSLFFVLSGFVMWINYAETFRDRPFADAFHGFMAARIARLYPMYFCIVVLALAAGGLGSAVRSAPWSLLTFLMLQSWIPGGHGVMAIFSIDRIGHLWSVSTEMFFYLLFPAIVMVVWRVRRVSRVLVLAGLNFIVFALLFYLAFRFGYQMLAPIAHSIGSDGMAWLTYYSPYLQASAFVSGCLAGYVFMAIGQIPVGAKERSGATSTGIALIAGFLCLPALLIAVKYHPQHAEFLASASRVVAVIVIPALLIHIARYETFLSRGLSLRWVLMGGECSYSIYLLHPFVESLFNMQGAGSRETILTIFVFRVIAFACFVTILAWGGYSLIERPGRVWLRRMLGNTSAPHPAAVTPSETSAAG